VCRRNSRWWPDLGDHYIVDLSRNMISDTRIDVTKYATKIGVLQAFEQLMD
jgi:hypothetical protein